MITYREPLLRAEEVKMHLTAHAVKRLIDRFGFPEDPEQIIEKLKLELPEGWLGENDRGCTVDFTTYPPIRMIVAVEVDKKEYSVITAMLRKELLVLGGYERKIIHWDYREKK